MSGTSLDGIDAALLETDGRDDVRPLAFHARSYTDAERDLLIAATRRALSLDRPAPDTLVDEAAALITQTHSEAVRQLLKEAGVDAAQVSVVGFHGQTVAHRPDQGWTWQIGSGAGLAASLGIAVVSDFRSADVAAGGQGAPLLPVYHGAMLRRRGLSGVILNLGGIGNLTWVGADGDLLAFDTGPANALLDDWLMQKRGLRFDENGLLAASGTVDDAVLGQMMAHPFFREPAPKSLDRSDFGLAPVAGLSDADGAATLAAFTARAVAAGLDLLPTRTNALFVAGGGRLNPTLMAMIGQYCAIVPERIEALGFDGDATEAEGFAYMAVRSLLGLPISFPGTTGVPRPMTGGRLDRP